MNKNKKTRILPSRNKNILENQNTGQKKNEKSLTSENKVQNSKKKIIQNTQLILKKQFITENKTQEINYISPSLNIAGNYNNYIEQIMHSIVNISNLYFDLINKEQREKKQNLKLKKILDNQISKNEIDKNKKLLLLDLDETLIHSEYKFGYFNKTLNSEKMKENCNHKEIKFKEGEMEFQMIIFIRPFLNDFLENMNSCFDLGIFTAALQNYAEAALKIIDPSEKFFKFKFFRDSCININDKIYIKDLSIIDNYDLKNIILVDNSLYSFLNNLNNGVLVNSFYYDENDKQLIFAKNYILNSLLNCDDVRIVNEETYNFMKQFNYYKSLYEEMNKLILKKKYHKKNCSI